MLFSEAKQAGTHVSCPYEMMHFCSTIVTGDWLIKLAASVGLLAGYQCGLSVWLPPPTTFSVGLVQIYWLLTGVSLLAGLPL